MEAQLKFMPYRASCLMFKLLYFCINNFRLIQTLKKSYGWRYDFYRPYLISFGGKDIYRPWNKSYRSSEYLAFQLSLGKVWAKMFCDLGFHIITTHNLKTKVFNKSSKRGETWVRVHVVSSIKREQKISKQSIKTTIWAEGVVVRCCRKMHRPSNSTKN